jgi:hypothetical protein
MKINALFFSLIILSCFSLIILSCGSGNVVSDALHIDGEISADIETAVNYDIENSQPDIFDDGLVMADDSAVLADDAFVQADDSAVQIDDALEDIPEDLLKDAAEDVVQDFSPAFDVDINEDVFEITQGGFLWECDSAEQCNSGLCVEYMGKKVCTVECIEQCPFEWVCKKIVTATFCLSPQAFLCRPCEMSSVCVTPQGMESVCVKYDGNASFCGTFCDTDENCPEGYECKKSKVIEGGELKVCKKKEGLCECTDLYEGKNTSCEKGNEYGICKGYRECKDKTWSDCKGEEPVAEICDGKDTTAMRKLTKT